MSWFDDLKKWFWGDLKPELQVTTDEVLEEEVKKKPKRRYTKTGAEMPKAEKEPAKKKKPKKPRKTKKKETGE